MSLRLSLISLAGLALSVFANENKPDLCSLTNAQFPGKVAFPNSTAYQNSQNNYFTAQERNLEPACVFRPDCTEDVSRFIKAAVANDPCKRRGSSSCSRPLFAVRSGGHTLWEGAANIDGGLTMDMRSFDSFSLSEDLAVASIGGGSNFATVYPQLVPHNLTVLGGRVPGVAAGGFLSGGGKGFLSRRHGFGCDNIHGYEVVLASGDVVHASASHNRDLWLALKGGSSNFGIITRYDLATFPLELMWGGTTSLNYSAEVLQAEAQAFSDFMRPENLDDAADVGVLLGFVNGSFFLENTIFYSDAVAEPPVFANFTSLEGITAKSLNLVSVADMVESNGAVVPHTIGRSFELVFTMRNADPAIYYQLMQIWQDGITAMSTLPGLQIQFLFQPMPVTNGTNSLGLPTNDSDLAMAVLSAAWDNLADDATATEGLRSIVAEQEDLLRQAGLAVGFKYLNYADVEQNPISTYGPGNIAKLWAASKKYDPKGFWQSRVPGYKLPA